MTKQNTHKNSSWSNCPSNFFFVLKRCHEKNQSTTQIFNYLKRYKMAYFRPKLNSQKNCADHLLWKAAHGILLNL